MQRGKGIGRLSLVILIISLISAIYCIVNNLIMMSIVSLLVFLCVLVLAGILAKKDAKKDEQRREIERQLKAEQERQLKARQQAVREEQQAIEQAECEKQQKEKQEKQQQQSQGEQRFYDYLMSNDNCILAIRNFTKYHLEILTKIVFKWEYNSKAFETEKANVNIDADRIRIYAVNDNFLEAVTLLTKVLIEDTTFSFDCAKPAVKQAILVSLLNGWILNLKKKVEGEESELLKELNFSNKGEGIRQYINSDIYIDWADEEIEFAFFLLLYDIKLKFDTNLSSLHELKKEFNDIYNRILDEEIEKDKEEKKKEVYENFKAAIFTHIDTSESGESFTMDDIDGMDGAQFEQYIAKLFEKMGYETEVTKHSGDQGIDVIAKNDIVTIGIQAKCYSSTVGNSAVQEAVGGKALYKVDKVMVITNNEFTPAAKQLAKANSVELWDRSKLQEKVAQYQN